MEHINWNPPEPRRGLAGSWDRFVGPGATSAEEWLKLLGGLLLTGALVMGYLSQRELLNWSVAQTGIALLLALDLTGGIITNATGAAKRWYHRLNGGITGQVNIPCGRICRSSSSMGCTCWWLRCCSARRIGGSSWCIICFCRAARLCWCRFPSTCNAQSA